ncbi:hypothetical protein SAMN05421786_10934 [Chryseobacterium ureilyticum]|uniref:Uncharacterized protein n=1 Tax=Chryseobacterium ureilyticum TaxID=373668 RepID=A0A1N7QDM6_9FLAO|nr:MULTISPECIES: hypothetical protein [Chryseobacterium]MCD9616071.1 hypothetical protein [Chryseobacterium gleum]UCA60464.1 hypothetical protein KB553_02780 [Chryseobacterium rhizoplanae]SIT20981.1 hypothetical protein SAMN05421786_10934 [Chryseobacterium ureilyticum]
MKSLKEFITENLEESTITTVQENTEQTNENQDDNLQLEQDLEVTEQK